MREEPEANMDDHRVVRDTRFYWWSACLISGCAGLVSCNQKQATAPASPLTPTNTSSNQAVELLVDSNQTVPRKSSSHEQPAPEGMVWIPTGTFMMGQTGKEADVRPAHQVTLDGFWMDKTEVTNEQFARFVKETDYVTVAERKLDPRDFPDVDPEVIRKTKPSSVVFTPPAKPVPFDVLRSPNIHMAWWRFVEGANWRHPQGPDSTIKGKEKHPVVHICWDDAVAYAKWAGKRLPTEAEWEYSARGRLKGKEFVWGDKIEPNGKPMANIWHGHFPTENTLRDGFRLTAPVGSFPPNGYGLFDMAGNVWEWVADWYRPDYYRNSPAKNPQGPPDSFDPQEPRIPKRVQRGGSYLCIDITCGAYRPYRRMKTSPDTGLSHAGFRCAKSP